MPYTKFNDPWVDYPTTTTPISASALNYIESGIAAGRSASAVGITDSGAYFTGTEVETALQEAGADIVALQSAGSVSIGMILVLGG